jgi:hypothetical protein
VTVAKVVHADKVLFKRNRWKTTMYFMLGDPKKEGCLLRDKRSTMPTSLDFLPHIPTKYFTKKEELKCAISTIKTIRRVPIKLTS